MKFDPPLKTAKLLKRYKRFLADVILSDGTKLTMHCPNTGAMTGCADPGSQIWYSLSANKNRKYPHTFELIEVAGLTGQAEKVTPAFVSVNTLRANKLVREALENGIIKELSTYQGLRSEVKYGDENSRIDFLLTDHQGRSTENCYVEVKSVTLARGEGLGQFPDAVSARGSKHLRELIQMKAQGHRAVLLFCVQHGAINRVEPADEIDPTYGLTLREAAAAGVEILAYKAKISSAEITLVNSVPVILPD